MEGTPRTDVVVVGAGVIGLSCAWALLRRGVAVTLVDPEPARGASYAAAGMLAPVTEAHVGEERLLALTLAGARAWPGFAAALEDATGLPSGYRAEGTLVVAHDADDRAVLKRLQQHQEAWGLDVTWLSSREARREEPMLAPDVVGALLVEGDHSVHNRQLLTAMLAAVERAGGSLLRRRVTAVTTDATGRASGVVLDDGGTIAAGTVVVAAGAWTSTLEGLPPGTLPPVRPVKGQILRLATTPDTGAVLRRTLRALVRGMGVYLVPRADGELAVGATTEERGFDPTVTAGGVWELLRDARAVLPVVTELRFVEAWAGLRPGTPDNAPAIGPTPVPGLVVATGHGRNGVLLAPVTGDAVAAHVVDGALPDVVRPFGPERFAGVAA